MENLTREYFLELREKYPEAVNHFVDWLKRYKEEVNWELLFGNRATEVERFKIDFYDLPYDMQNGIMARFDIECFLGKGGYKKIKSAETQRYEKLFTDLQGAINDGSVK